MKRNRLFMLIIVAILTLGSAISSLAAEGWAQEGNTWVYLDDSGKRMTGVWKKGSDGLWRYLGSSGEMAISVWVEDTYYMDSNGILVTDKWMKIQEPGDSFEDNSEEFKWYFFGTSGKVITDAWKKIDDKWYYFDSDGVMLTGWILDDMYFTGSDGVMKIGWQSLYPPDYDDNENNNQVTPSGGTDDDGRCWFYFASNGKKKLPENGKGDFQELKIEGSYYCFDEKGAMQTGWVNVGNSDDADASIEDYRYFDTNGKGRVGWYSTESPEAIASRYENDVEWFYFSSKGVPKVGAAEGSATSADIIKINGKSFLFNEDGNPVYGLQKIALNSSSGQYTAYYFGDKAASSMQHGKQKIDEGDGTSAEFYFSENGKGYTGVRDNYLYYMGKLQKADSGVKYSVISLPNGNSHTNYVVNTSGKLAKSTTVKNADGVKYKTSSSGSLTSVDDESPGAEAYESPVEPVWDYR